MNGRVRATMAIFGPGWWIVAIFVATLWVWQRYEVVRAGHRIERLQAHTEELTKARDALLAEDASLTSRSRIETIAINYLGMTPTTEAQRVHLPRPAFSRDGQSPGQTATSASAPQGSPRFTQAKDGTERMDDF